MSNVSRREWLACLLAAGAAAADWKTLFDGKTLHGWKPEGNSSWTVEDGAIVGRQGPGGAAGDLFTERQWADFELELEWKMRFPGNSGIWFRRSAHGTGYQADFLDQASHPGVLSGSLYCMGKEFIAENRDPATVRRDDWNKLRIRAAGDHYAVILNGKQVVDVRDSTFRAPGSIGIQAHAGENFKDMEIRVRNIRLRPL